MHDTVEVIAKAANSRAKAQEKALFPYLLRPLRLFAASSAIGSVDWELLRQYVPRDSNEAFAALLKCHVSVVYSVVLRHTFWPGPSWRLPGSKSNRVRAPELKGRTTCY
jgi:hypothetical protein